MSKRPTTTHVALTIADGTYTIPCSCEDRVSIGLSNETVGTVNAGSLTFRGRIQGEEDFQDINDVNVIDFTAYSGLTVDVASLEALEVTTSGVGGAGLGTEIFLALNAR